jgi:hypothetical protein
LRLLVAGYSGNPLSKKLGIKSPMTLVTIDAPMQYRTWVGKLPQGVDIVSRLTRSFRAAHVFATRKADLEKHLPICRKCLEQTGFVWVSWPKKASKVETDITEDAIREVALPLGFVDIKVCAVNEVWSALKLVVRKSERAAKPGVGRQLKGVRQ